MYSSLIGSSWFMTTRVQDKDKYLVQWKGFMVEGNIWKSRKSLENVRNLLREFEEEYGRDNWEVRQQEKVEDNKDYWRGGFSGWYATKRLFG